MSVIEDGTGGSRKAIVDDDNFLRVRSSIISQNTHVNIDHQDAYLLYSDVTPTGSGSVCLYVKNTSQDKNMILNWYRVWSGTNPEALDVFFNPVGTPGNTTEILPTNMNLGSSKSALGDFYESVGMTGLTLGSIVDRIRLAGNGEDVIFGWPGQIIITPGSSFAMVALTGSSPVEITVSFFYESARG